MTSGRKRPVEEEQAHRVTRPPRIQKINSEKYIYKILGIIPGETNGEVRGIDVTMKKKLETLERRERTTRGNRGKKPSRIRNNIFPQ